MISTIVLDGDNISVGQSLTVDGERFNHIVNSRRVKPGQNVTLFNGSGKVYLTVIQEIKSKSVLLSVLDQKNHPQKLNINLYLCIPKKPAFEDCVRSSVEMGIKNLIPVFSEFSQRDMINESRIRKIQESAVIQSKNPYFVCIKKPMPIENLRSELDSYETVFYFSTDEVTNLRATTKENINLSSSIAIIIGAEGGFSDKEHQMLKSLKNIYVSNLPTPVLKTNTAVCTGTGFVLSKLTQ